MTIRLTLPQNAQLQAKIGSLVNIGDQFYSSVEVEHIQVNVAEKLQIDGDQLFHHLTKIIGEPIVKGEVLATKKGILRTKKVHADQSGTITEINHTTGQVRIAVSEGIATTTDFSQNAFFLGKIEAYDKVGHTVTVAIEKAEEIPLKTISADGGGELYFFLDEGHYFTASEDQINDKIIVVDDLKPHIVAKCEALGCAGFVYLKSRPDISVAGVQCAKITDFESLVKNKKKYILYSVLDKKALLYD